MLYVINYSSLNVITDTKTVVGDKLYVNLHNGKVITKEFIKRKRIKKKDYIFIGICISSSDDNNYSIVRLVV